MYLEPSTNYGDGFNLHKVIGNKFYRFHGVWDGYEEIIARYLLTLIIDWQEGGWQKKVATAKARPSGAHLDDICHSLLFELGWMVFIRVDGVVRPHAFSTELEKKK